MGQAVRDPAPPGVSRRTFLKVLAATPLATLLASQQLVRAESTSRAYGSGFYGEGAYGPPAPATDATPPEILHVPPEQAVVGEALALRATVTDDVGVSEAVLHYQEVGAASFVTSAMEEVEPDVYEATVPPQDTEGDLFYHIEARDAAGNGGRSPHVGEYHLEVVSNGQSGKETEEDAGDGTEGEEGEPRGGGGGQEQDLAGLLLSLNPLWQLTAVAASAAVGTLLYLSRRREGMKSNQDANRGEDAEQEPKG